MKDEETTTVLGAFFSVQDVLIRSLTVEKLQWSRVNLLIIKCSLQLAMCTGVTDNKRDSLIRVKEPQREEKGPVIGKQDLKKKKRRQRQTRTMI